MLNATKLRYSESRDLLPGDMFVMHTEPGARAYIVVAILLKRPFTELKVLTHDGFGQWRHRACRVYKIT